MLRSVGLSLWMVFVAVATAGAQDYDRGWVDVNFGAAKAAEEEYTSTRVLTISQEPGGGAVAYGLPRGGAFDVGGGYMFSSRAGLGVSLAGTAHEDTAGLAISIPHPFFFNASATDATVTNGTLTRTEGAWHIHAMLVAVSTPHLAFASLAGRRTSAPSRTP
jgi:hypothetical protein